MGCDIHLKLERCVHGVDAATVAARTALLIIAERAKKQAEHEPQNAFERMPPELWQRCATLVSVTNGGRVDKWLECPFADWVFTNEAKFIEMSLGYKQKVAASMEEQWATLFEQNTFENEDDREQFKWENYDDVYDKATTDAAPSGVRPARFVEGTGYMEGTGYWNDLVGDLDQRNYNRFGLFSNQVGSVRSQQHLAIKQLSCVRAGWPADVNEDARQYMLNDPNLHSHGCATLAGLFAVDWDVGVSSTARSGRALRPTGAFVGTPYQNEKKRHQQRLGLINGYYGEPQEPSLNGFNLALLFDIDGSGAYPPGWDDMTMKQKCEAVVDKIMAKAVQIGRVAADDDGVEEEVETAGSSAGGDVETDISRRDVMEALEPAASMTSMTVSDGLMEMEERMLESGASPADFRLLICFDN